MRIDISSTTRAELRVVTWNVLHRVHAMNWDETVVTGFPEEHERIARITEMVASWLDSGISVVCLQEVSGDQLASLRSQVGGGAEVFTHAYPRIPRLRAGGSSGLSDTTEHLVALTRVAGAKLVGSATFPDDPGKGFVTIRAADVLVTGAHVSYAARGQAQLATLAAAARTAGMGAVVCGDFNAERNDVRAALGDDCALSDVSSGGRPTRAATASSPAHDIDHVAVFRGTIASCVVLDGRALSDHNPVVAALGF